MMKTEVHSREPKEIDKHKISSTSVFQADELGAVMKVENHTQTDACLLVPIIPTVTIVKSEIAEFGQFGKSHTIDTDTCTGTGNFNLNEVNTVILEKIPKTELVCSDVDEDPNPSLSSNEEDDDVLYKDIGSNEDEDEDEDSTSDLERDPFADVDCDPCFSQMPQRDNFKDSITYANASGANNQSSTSSSSKCNTVPTANSLKHDNNSQRQTLLASKLQCGLCLENQSWESILKTHLEICAASHKNRHRFCVPCNKLFSSPQAYRLHALNNHGVKEAKFYRYPFKCEFCPRSFALEDTLLFHSLSHYQSNSANDNGSSDSSSITLPFKCNECTSLFANLHSLTRHAKSHSNERPVKCPVRNCGKAFKSNGNLKEHLRRIHSDERPFKCPEPNCGKTFKMNGQLQKHLVCHSEARPFQCLHSNCSKMFKNKERLTKHLAAHSGARRYKHITERPFKCEQCDRAYVKNWQLTAHLKAHANKVFQCPELNCDSKFKYLPNLKVHIDNFHGNNKDFFSCPEPNCTKKFKYKKSVTEHLSTHTGERPFKCSQPGCSAEFVRSTYLNLHMKNKHRSKQNPTEKKTVQIIT